MVAVSLVWAVSFGLLKHHLAGIHPDLVNAIRMSIALLVFVPWLRGSSEGASGASGHRLRLAAVGAVQFGLMYSLYNRSFAFLEGHQVALATLLTPLYVTILDDLLSRRIRWRFLAAAILSVGGAAISIGAGSVEGGWRGLLLLQAANLCFALGQIAYRRTLARRPAVSNAHAMAWAYVGAVVIVGLAAIPQLPGVARIESAQWIALGWLGVVASGLCFFWWNAGARMVNTGVLSVMNDLKIPLGVAASLLVFGEAAEPLRLAVGSTIVGFAWWLASRPQREAEPRGVEASDAAASTIAPHP